MTSYGYLSLLPPLIAIICAFISKDVIVSLCLGVLSGLLIINNYDIFSAVLAFADLLAKLVGDSWNVRILMFCAMLGALVAMLSATGAASAFGQWASTKVRSRRGAGLMSFVFGIFIFIDDYFNSLAVGTIMRPISDKMRVCRAKLAYILDSTAAPVCIIAPISSWVVTVMSALDKTYGFEKLNMTPFEFFIHSIIYNLYAISTLIFVLYIIISGRDFGPMAKAQALATNSGKLFNEHKYGACAAHLSEEKNERAKPIDMLLPLILLVLSAVIFFPLSTYLASIDGEKITSLAQAWASISLSDAFKNTDASVALFYAITWTILLSYIYFIARGLLSLSKASASLELGIKSMVPALIILALAWCLGTIIKAAPSDGGLGLGFFLSEIFKDASYLVAFLPLAMFIISAIMAFATGTSWGTFAIMIPLAMPIILALMDGADYDQTLTMTLMSIAAVLSGAVLGDHISIISDTTILSSTGAGCPHLEHVSTQMPYALFVAIACAAGFLAGAMAQSLAVAWVATLALMFGGIIMLSKLTERFWVYENEVK
ncbi:sodium:proton antiporter, NhaC family [Candidatus Campylobacter infans]|uniref:Sodium:proton antiporter, NhaC family n=1 Tax=Candidatus Campylobacter infans TaxID=2561898 RepID=A0A7H9CGN2_9BACT|nr:Na+/H+ antiporter NhaC family protein [Candidatus Campylobacter infans]QLI05246.1 sodium:proton antiporter, NhaC family [Candidatus Campylobacter infans]